jgi:hypothetical protein
MSEIAAIESVRQETGCGRSMTVTHRFTAVYADREPSVSVIATSTLLDVLQRGGVPRADASSVARYGGRLVLADGAWTLDT